MNDFMIRGHYNVRNCIKRSQHQEGWGLLLCSAYLSWSPVLSESSTYLSWNPPRASPHLWLAAVGLWCAYCVFFPSILLVVTEFINCEPYCLPIVWKSLGYFFVSHISASFSLASLLEMCWHFHTGVLKQHFQSLVLSYRKVANIVQSSYAHAS
jgi:hypothetical protein